jgi:hypothetical protein
MKMSRVLGIFILALALVISSALAVVYYADIGEFLRMSRGIEETSAYGTSHAMQATSSQFQVNGCGEGTVLDTVTNICWERNWSGYRSVDGDGVNWTQAVTYCDELTLAGKSDWSLPNLKELRRLMPEHDMSQFSYYGATDNGYWKDFGFQFTAADEPGGLIWTKTEAQVSSSGRAWFVNLDSGSDASYDQDSDFRAVCSVWND